MKLKKREQKSGETNFYDPERKDSILGRNQSRLELWKEHYKDPIVALDSALKCVETSCLAGFWPETFCGSGLQWSVVQRAQVSFQRCGKSFLGERVWPYFDRWDSVRLRTASTHWNVPGK